MKTSYKFFILINLGFSFLKTNAQITVTTVTPANATNLVLNNLLAPSGIMPGSVQNVTYNGVPSSLATFTGTSNIGFANGIILSSDNASLIPDAASNQTEGPSYPGLSDPQLAAISTGTVQDAAVLQFDFQPLTDTLKFKYVFGSEEYPEYVCSGFNDVFGFFISGPSPTGPNYNNYNIARIPGTTLPVTINSINPGVPGANAGVGNCSGPGQSLAYSSLYTANSGATIIFDGLTHVLEAIIPVKICGTYHVKLAVANCNDEVFNSAVFLEANSFGGNFVPLYANGGTQVSQDSSLLCIGDTLTLTAPTAMQYNWGVSGTTQTIQVTQPGVYFCLVSDTIFTCAQISASYYVISDPTCFVGLTNFCNSDFFTISPNPFKDGVMIHSKEKLMKGAVISVLSLTGEEVKQIVLEKPVDDFQLSLKEFSAGIYFLRTTNGTETIVKKLIHQ